MHLRHHGPSCGHEGALRDSAELRVAADTDPKLPEKSPLLSRSLAATHSSVHQGTSPPDAMVPVQGLVCTDGRQAQDLVAWRSAHTHVQKRTDERRISKDIQGCLRVL